MATLWLMHGYHRTPFLNPFFVFTAYSLTTTSSVSGNCVKYTSSPIPLFDAHTAHIEATINLLTFISSTFVVEYTYGVKTVDPQLSSLSQDGYSSFLAGVYSTFLSAEGLAGCTASIPRSQHIPAYLGSSIDLATAPSAETSAGSSTPGRRVHPTQIIVLSVVLPTAGIMILLSCFVIIRRYRKKRSQAAPTNHPETISNTQLYVDQKAELEADERRRHELESGRIMHEMDGEDTVFEMPDDSNSRMQLASSHRTHELRGPDHSQELEALSNI